MKRPIDYRDPRLVVALLGALYDSTDPVPELELVEIFSSSSWSTATIRRTLGELVALGAATRSTGPPNKRHPARYRMTPLGRAWSDRRLEPYVGSSDDDEEPEHPATR